MSKSANNNLHTAVTSLADAIKGIPSVENVTGRTLQSAINDLNRAWLNLLRAAALLGKSEPLSASLLDLPWETILMFEDPRVIDRMMDQSFGFPLVKARIQEPRVIAQIIEPGSSDDAAVRALTASMPRDVLDKAFAKRRP